MKCMKITKFFKIKNEKGISPTIATVLIFVTATAILIIVYTWTTGFVSEMVDTDSVEVEYMVLESQRIIDDGLEIIIRNSSDVDIVIKNVIIEGEEEFHLAFQSENTTIPKGETITMNFDLDNGISVGSDLTLITERGTKLKFRVRG